MTAALRIVLFIASICMVIFVLRGIRKSKLRIEDSIFWVFFSLLILILSIFPEIAAAAATAIGISAPVNFIFLFFIFILLLKMFSMSKHISQLETSVKELTQQVAIGRLERQAMSADGVHDAKTTLERERKAQQQASQSQDGDA